MVSGSNRGIAAVAALVALAAVLGGCSGAGGGIEPGTPEAAVQGLLELRSKNTTDPSAYLSFVATGVAGVLAADSIERERDDRAILEWETPVQTGESSAVAKVTVEWLRSAEHTG